MSERSLGTLLIMVWILTSALPAAASPIDGVRAHRYFREAEAISQRDGGRLWGVGLYGPMLLVDPPTRAVVANQADQRGFLREQDGVFIGDLPAEVNIANTAVEWAGVRWTMLVWPLPGDAEARARLMAHELWHRIQNRLGLPASNPANIHLDTLPGRLWLRLEWKALNRALASDGNERRRAVEDALIFRAYRHLLFEAAATEERLLQLNEGLAEYTGVRLAASDPSGAVQAARGGLASAPTKDTFVRSFAYASGPAYGLLLDVVRPGWRDGLSTDDDLGAILAGALGMDLPEDPAGAAEKRGVVYGLSAIRSAEQQREHQRQTRLAKYRARFVEGSILRIPLRQMQVQFNPSNLQPLEDLGTVYPTMRISDVWGVLEVDGGALLSPDWSSVTVPAPASPDRRPVSGDGWTLGLKPGWDIVPMEHSGNYTLTRDAMDK